MAGKKGASLRIDGLMIASAVVLAGGVFVWVQRKKLIEAFNPSDRENIFHRAANNIGDILNDGLDNDNFSLGASVHDLLNE